MSLTVQDVFEKHIPERIAAKPDMPAKINSVYQFVLSGDGGGEYFVDLTQAENHVQKGTHASPNVTVTMAAGDFINMIGGKLNAQMAFMSGKLKVKGEMALALKLQQLLG